MKRRSVFSSIRRGYTLMEMGLAIMVGLSIASILMILMSQQLTFLKIIRAQGFLASEAPLINNQLARIIGQADRFRIHKSVADAVAGTNPVMSGGSVVLLYFRQPDGTMLKGIISYETNATKGKGLYYYTMGVGATTAKEPDWAISKRPTAVTFSIDSGILRTTLTGPSSEQITYSGTMQQ